MAEALQRAAAELETINGPGWVLLLVEGMRAEWGCTLPQALFEESLNATLCLWPALLTRHGVEIHDSPEDRARQQAKEAKRRHIADHYHVVPTPPEMMPGRRKSGAA